VQNMSAIFWLCFVEWRYVKSSQFFHNHDGKGFLMKSNYTEYQLPGTISTRIDESRI
jgi:hypothetical protein